MMMKKNHGLSGSSGIADAIARMEGYYVPNSIAARNNNPGNLRSGQGQIGTNGGFAVFATPEDGFAALQHQIDLNSARGLNLYEFFGGGQGYPGYAPSADSNNPTAYADFVASVTGIDPNVPLNSLEVASDASADPFAPSDVIPGISNTVLALIAVTGLVALTLFSGGRG